MRVCEHVRVRVGVRVGGGCTWEVAGRVGLAVEFAREVARELAREVAGRFLPESLPETPRREVAGRLRRSFSSRRGRRHLVVLQCRAVEALEHKNILQIAFSNKLMP